jgi:hypothetical protein
MMFVFMLLSYQYIFKITNQNCNKYQNDICDSQLSSISADKSDQFVPKVSNDIPIEILIFVRSEVTEKKVLNISSDICDKTFRVISTDKSDQFIPKVSNDIYIEILIFFNQKELNRKY